MTMRLNKKLYAVIPLLITSLFGSDWVDLGSSSPVEPDWEVNPVSEKEIQVALSLGGYNIETTNTNGKIISFPGGVPILEKGAPDLPRIARSIIIPDMAHMKLTIIDTDFVDIQIEDIESSKGNITRDIDPSSIPHTYGKAYQKNEFYPKEISFLRDPYILRSYRGQAIVFQPIQYNPIQRILRVYTHIKLNIQQEGISQLNALTRRPPYSGSREFQQMYRDHFINYTENERYDVLGEQGPMLVISYGEFLEAMQPFVDWKNYKGIPTEIHDIAEIGDVDEMEAFIEDQYYENGIAFVLLVGDIDQIETIRRSNGAGSNSPSDNSLTFVAGNDYYPDLVIGRFSAETIEHVTTMVDRTISYEMNPDSNADWYKKGAGFASNQGPGDDGEDDDEHMDNIRELLLDYTYIEVDQVYDPDGTVAEGEEAINEGRSIINYTGHGSNGSWGNGCPMNNTDVNGLVNVGRWPFIWSVACVNGEFEQGTCYAETWLRATDTDGTPTGAIAALMSTVNQAWNPPMEGQDEMNAIFVESYSDNIKRTFGGLSFNGMNQMNDSYGTAGYDETCYWTIFGDPSVVVRSDTPSEMSITHNSALTIGSSELVVNADVSGALVAISREGELLASGHTDETGYVNLLFENSLDIPGYVNLVVTAYNKVPYEQTIDIIDPEGAYMLFDDFVMISGDDDILDYGEEASLYVVFQNVGQEASDELTFTLTHQGSMVNIITEEIVQDPVASGDQVSVGPFEFIVDWNLEDGSTVPLLVSVMSDSSDWDHSLVFNVQAPAYQLISIDFGGNGNGTLDPGESASIEVIIENNGNAPVVYPTFEVNNNDPYITVDDIVSNDATFWGVGTQLPLIINLNIASNTPLGYYPNFNIDIGAADTPYEHGFPIPLTVGILLEDFETGNFNSFNWTQGGDADWTIDNEYSSSGIYSAKSGEIGHDQTSELSLMMNVLNEGNIIFWARSSSEQGNSGVVYDYLEFYIDDEPQELEIGGENDWEEYSIALPVGEHLLRWVYKKDEAESEGDDCVWIDGIQFPPGTVSPLNIDFGDLNDDGIVNILDVIVTVNHVIGFLELDQEQTQNADMNLDGIVNILDVLLVVDQVIGE